MMCGCCVFGVRSGSDSKSSTKGSAVAQPVGGDLASAVREVDPGVSEFPVPPSAPGLGAPVRDGKFEFVASKMECGISTLGSGVLAEAAQGQFCVLTMSVENIGDEAQSFSVREQKLKAGKTEYSASWDASYAVSREFVVQIQVNPGIQISGQVAFDVPKGVRPQWAVLHDSMFSNGAEVALR